MDSPKRKQLKRNDYLRHKMFRKIRKQQKAELEQQKKAAEKELKRRLRVTPLPKFDDGAVPTLFKPEDDVTYTRTNVNSQLIGMDPSTGVWYDRTNGKRLGDSVAIDDIVVTPKNGNIDDFGNVYNTVGGVTTRTSPDGRKTIVAETPVSNVDPAGLFFVEGAALSPLFRPAELVAGSPELVKLAKQTIETAYRKKMGSFFGGLAAQMDSRLLNSSKIGIGDAEKNVLAGKVGWAPKQTFTGYHASDDPNMVPDYFKDTWSIKNHNAPHGFYIAGGRSPYRGFLTKRPYIYDVEALFDKPMVQLGESIGTTKNTVRNDIERYAQLSGADGIIFNGIADNLMQNQFIAKTLNPDVVLNANRRLATISMTPEQWTAAQDAAIARSDMTEAQRLSDLHGAVNDYHSGFYHETKKPFVKFNRPGKNSIGDLLSPFGVFTKRTNKSIGLGEYQMPLNVRYKNPLHVNDKRELFEMLPEDLQKEIKTLYRYQFHNTDQLLWSKRAFLAKQKIGKFLSDNNYDALIIDKDWAGTGLTESERWTDATIVPSPGMVKSADAVTYDDNGIRIPLGERHNFNINDNRYDIADSDFESFTIPTEELQTSLNAPINNPVVINGKEYPTMKTLMNKVEMIKPDLLNAAHLLAQREIRQYVESPEYKLRLIDNGFDPDKYISALEHYLGSRVKYGDLNSRTKGVTEIVNGEPEITLNNSVFDTDYDALIHELAHALTKNLDHSMYVKNFIDTRLKDIMLYNEKILPQLDRDIAARSGVSIDRLTYLNDPLEIRARMISIIMDARRKGVKLSEYIDKVKSNRLLNDLKSFLKVEDIKKYGANILGVTPFAIPFAKKNKLKSTK